MQSAELSFRAWADSLADATSPAAKKGFWEDRSDERAKVGLKERLV